MLKTNFNKVRDFMHSFGQEVQREPKFPSDDIIALRISLIVEELEELVEGVENRDIVEVADALTDLLYVTYGMGLAFGIHLDNCFDEVHLSNMSKLGPDGRPIYREDGKVLKGPSYFAPNLKQFI